MSADLVLEYVLAAALAVAMARLGYVEGKLRTVMAIDALRALLVDRLRSARAVTPVLERNGARFKIEAEGTLKAVLVYVGETCVGRWDTADIDLEVGDEVLVQTLVQSGR